MPAGNIRRRPIRRGPGLIGTLDNLRRAHATTRGAVNIAQRLFGRTQGNSGNFRAQNRAGTARHNPFPSMQATLAVAQRQEKNPLVKAALALRQGVNMDLVQTGRSLTNRNFALQEIEIEKALKEFQRLTKRQTGKNPHNDRLRQTKNQILWMMLEEGKINSFEDMRDALIGMANQTGGKLGIRTKREFDEFFSKKEMFNERERELLERIFQKKFEKFMAEWH